jgi:uncharacterized membrane protein YdfJ with MMPL/SSD domain
MAAVRGEPPIGRTAPGAGTPAATGVPARMIRLDRLLRRRRAAVLATGVLVLAAAIPLAAHQSDGLSAGGFEVHGSQSAAVTRALGAFPAVPRSELAVVLVSATGAGLEDLRTSLGRVERVARATAHVRLDLRSVQRARSTSQRGETLLVPLVLDVSESRAVDVASSLRRRLDVGAGPRAGVTTYLVGEGAMLAGLRDVAKRDLANAERTGFPIVLLILIVAFGSVGASTLPIAIGLFSVTVTGAAIFFLSHLMQMSVYVTNMASMIGIGVAVDYSLFILVRYREEIAAGNYRALARGRALATSGLAVTFSGLTVMIALSGLWLIDEQAIRSMALGAIIVVAVSVIAALTLLPVLIQRFGHSAYMRHRLYVIAALLFRSLRWRQRNRGSTHPDRAGGFWVRWSALIMRHPVPTVVLVGGLLVALAVPALSLRMGESPLQEFARGDPVPAGVAHAAAVAGPGAFAPVRVLVSFRAGGPGAPSNRALLELLQRRIAVDPGIVRILPPLTARDGRRALLAAVPAADGESDAAMALVGRLRPALRAIAGGRAVVAVGGVTASQRDLRDLIAGSMWKVVLWVLALALVVLVVVLRSIVLALKAVLMNLLSVGAAYGVLVVVFQWGWLDGVAGIHGLGRVGTLTPPLVLAVVFGLSMDYEIFLLSRVRERYEATGDTRRAVTEALASSGRAITSAALIMVSVFSVFIFTGVPTIKELGMGNAVAIAIDATLVRLTLVPATMVLLGRANWWLPRPLARVLSRSAFEATPSTRIP